MSEQIMCDEGALCSKEIQNDLLIRSLNYHGQQLTSLIKDEPIFRVLDLKNIDYHLYQARYSELKMDERGYRLDLHRFIASNIKQIFKVYKTKHNTSDTEDSAEKINDASRINDKNEKLVAYMPPYELFATLNIDPEDRIRHVFEILEVHEVLYCKVVALNSSGILLNACSFAGTNLSTPLHQKDETKSRYIEDLKIKCFCPADELVGSNETSENGRVRSYQTGDFVCVVILEVKRDAQRLLVSMKCDTLLKPELAKNKCKALEIRLGLVPNGVVDLPPTFKNTLITTEKSLRYDALLKSSEGFRNPTNVEGLVQELGLSNITCDSTLMSTLGSNSKGTYAKQLRKKQNASASYRHVSKGVKHFKAGETSEAFQCLNAALKIDEDNVEGYVARGALYANNGSLLKAIEDFEAALKLKNDHKNAVKYLHETLLAQGQNYENDNNFSSAKEAYNKVLARDPSNLEAREKIYSLLLTSGKRMEREKNLEEAVDCYSKAMATETKDKEAKCRLLSLKLRYKGTNIEQRIMEILKSVESDNGDGKPRQETNNRHKRNSLSCRESFESNEKEMMCNEEIVLEEKEKLRLRRDSSSKQNCKFNDNHRSIDYSPDNLGRREASRKSNSEDEISDYKSRKRRISSEILLNPTKKRALDSQINRCDVETNGQKQYTSFDQNTQHLNINKNRTTRRSNVESTTEEIEKSTHDFCASDSIQNPSQILETSEKDHPLIIPTIFNHPPPNFSSAASLRPKSKEELEYERAVNSFIQNTKKGLIKESSSSQSRRYYDNDGKRIYHPDDPRSKHNQRNKDKSSSKSMYSEDDEKGKNWFTTSEEQAPRAKMDKEEIFKRSLKETHNRDVLHKDQPNSMLEEIGKLSKAINLDELDKRLNRHFDENEEETNVENEQSDKIHESREKKIVLTEGSSNINSHINKSNRENDSDKFDAKTNSVILPVMRDNTVHQYSSEESNILPDKKSDDHMKDSKDRTMPPDSFDDILHKVMATCSRVEQRLSEKRKVRKSVVSASPKYSASKGFSETHSEEKRVIRRLPDSPINRSTLVSNQKKEKSTSPHYEDDFDCSTVKSSSRDRSAPKDRNTSTFTKNREKSPALRDILQESHRSSKHNKEIRTSKQEREERHRSNYWHKSESHDANSRSYSRHNRRDRQKDFISSSRNGKRTYDDHQVFEKDSGRNKSSHKYNDKRIAKATSDSCDSAGKILPGASSLEDINSFINAAKKEKLEQLKKKSNF